MDGSRQHGLEHVALPTAAIVVYHRITGALVEFSDAAEMNEVLQRVSHVLSNVVPIYSLDEDSATPRQLSPGDLLNRAFQRGATMLRKSDGTECHGLTVRRDDMRSAIAILSRAGIKF